jgi:hypothetical protein
MIPDSHCQESDAVAQFTLMTILLLYLYHPMSLL